MKTEKENMLSGSYYNPGDEELIKERDYAKDLLFEFNHTRPGEKEKRHRILKQLILAKGTFYIEAPFYCDYGYNTEVGENFYANYGCIILDVNKVWIGDNVLFGAICSNIYCRPPDRPRGKVPRKGIRQTNIYREQCVDRRRNCSLSRSKNWG